jgi:hypothetical protein
MDIEIAGDAAPSQTTLGQIAVTGGDSGTPFIVTMGHNLGSPTLLMRVPIYDFHRISLVANDRGPEGEAIAQRRLDPKHAEKLAGYVLRGLLAAAVSRRRNLGQPVPSAYERIQKELGTQPYLALQPIVTNLRTVSPRGENLRAQQLKAEGGEPIALKVWLTQRDVLWVVDGQHRRKALDLVFQFLDEVRQYARYPLRGLYRGDTKEVGHEDMQVWLECYEMARGHCSVNVEVHLGLGVDEERQLFHDLNNLAKKVEMSLALEFDSANPVNAFIKDVLLSRMGIRVVSFDVLNWDEDDGSMARKDLVAVNALLFLNKGNINGAKPMDVTEKAGVATRFWEAVASIPNFGEPGAKRKTIAAQPVMLKALAKLTHDFAFGRKRNEEHLSTLLDGISDIDFSHRNPAWRWYELSAEQRVGFGLAGLERYLPDETDGNRDVGRFQALEGDTGVMRFGAKHNDIHPILGDMIRWSLGLPIRHRRGAGADDGASMA